MTIIIDGSALVHSLPPRKSKTFEQYAVDEVVPKIKSYATKYERTDIVFNVYWPSSWKQQTRTKRGPGSRQKVTDLKLEQLFKR